MTYRATPSDGVAWVTGASAGIGRGVALELARRGYEVYATARRAEELQSLAGEATGLKGRILPTLGDVTDREGIARLVADIESRRPIELAFLNAGGSFPDAPGDFGGEGFARTFALNVQGVANGLNPVFNAMRARRRGQIAIVGSVTGYGGLPGSGAYAPSKAAVISLAVGARFSAARHNVTIQVVNPGYVKTPLTAENTFPMPFLMECDDACRRICDGFERGGFEIRFPRPLVWILKFLGMLPYPAYFALLGMGGPRGKAKG
ncbi:MAG TPA: SDR family NAD(P)-dependent oxidoreductase [Roseiarcus sp.]|jgi:NAD(P)-dependent dehydrogenase (short-subunit alcohol dehydrogenase family)